VPYPPGNPGSPGGLGESQGPVSLVGSDGFTYTYYPGIDSLNYYLAHMLCQVDPSAGFASLSTPDGRDMLWQLCRAYSPLPGAACWVEFDMLKAGLCPYVEYVPGQDGPEQVARWMDCKLRGVPFVCRTSTIMR